MTVRNACLPGGLSFFIKIINILRRNICIYQKLYLLLTRINNLITVI